MKVPRLKLGTGVTGPDCIGCFNTGMAPSILHSRTWKLHTGYDWVVGENMYVHTLATETILKHSSGQFKTVYKDSGRERLRLFKTRAPAVRHFEKLCDQMNKSNDKERQAAQRARIDLRGKNPEKAIQAVFTLGDMGLI